MFAMWVDADRFGALYRSGRRLGRCRAITDFGCALEQDAGADFEYVIQCGVGEKG
jgi:hypothetical protein